MRNGRLLLMCRYLSIFMTCLLAYCWSPEISQAQQAEKDKVENKKPSVFLSVTLAPAKVAEGDQMVVKAVFSVSKSGLWETLPVQYYYEIQKDGDLFFKSSIKKIQVVNGAKSVLKIKAEAPGGYGNYKFVLKLVHPEGTDRADMNFSVVSPGEARAYAYKSGLTQEAPSIRSSPDNRLVGKWRFTSPNPNAPSPVLTITMKNDGLAADMSREGYRTQSVKLKKSDKALVLQSKMEDSSSDCWFVVEDYIAFNSQMDNMPVRSRVLEGNQCASVGKVSESRLCRIR